MHHLVEYIFFFGLLGTVVFLVWLMLNPFISALALAAIIVTVCYPLYRRVVKLSPRRNETIAALITTLIVVVLIFLPVFLLASSLVNEALSIYNESNVKADGLLNNITTLENAVEIYAPGVDLNMNEYVKQGAAWLAKQMGAIFAATASTIFLFFIALIGSFYLFRDGRVFTKKILALSPLPDVQDELIMHRLARAVRSVVTGTLMLALIQGTLTGFGLWLFGFDRFVLWGTLASLGALIPGVGTTVVFVPAVIYLIVIGSFPQAIGLAIWGMLAVGLIDNLLGPYLMGRGSSLHPFIVLLAVLGGISVFGPIGFVIGPVIVNLLIVLLELYLKHLSDFAAADTIKHVKKKSLVK